MNVSVNKGSILLFGPESANLQSPTFELRGQRTIVAVGLQPGDYITFEVLKLTAGDRATYCGCILTPAQMAQLQGVQELQCPACEPAAQRPVRLTPQNPIVVLDAPQDTLLRAVYHGEGVEMRTVHVWGVETHTPNLSDTMRGCPPLFFEEEDQTWTPTGAIICLPDQVTVLVEQVNDCGRRRWAESEDPQRWVDTGQIRCLDDQTTIENEQVNQCGDRRWVTSETENVWTRTGQKRCLRDEETIEFEERSTCGNTRWVPGVDEEDAQRWAPTGIRRCTDDGVEIQEENDCGHKRWVLCGDVSWVATGKERCLDDGETVEIEEINQCGITRWSPADYGQGWVATGKERCVGADYQQLEVNRCGHLRWTTIGAVAWVATGVVRCGDTVVEVQEVNQCGLLRWTYGGTVTWTETGYTSCRGGETFVQEVNDCGTLRWVNTGVPCGESVHTASLALSPLSGEGGAEFCWEVTLDKPVAGADLELVAVLSGDEQTANGYDAPTVTIPIGETTGQLCVTTDASTPGTPDRELCLTLVSSARLPAAPPALCAIVQNPGSEAIQYSAEISAAPATDSEGETFTFTVDVTPAVADSDLTLQVVLSGSEQAAHSYASPRSVTIPIGQTQGSFTVTTVNDAAGGADTTLTGTLQSNARLSAIPTPSASVTVEAVEPEPPAVDCECTTGWYGGPGYLPSYGVYATEAEAEAAAALLGGSYEVQTNGINCWHVVRMGDVFVDQCPPLEP